MKKNNLDFSVPSRQSYVSILLILFRTVNLIVRQVWPIVLLVFLGGGSKSDKTSYILMAVIVIAILAMLFSILNYFKTYFFVKNDELIINKGVLTKVNINIPFERIQTINFEQNIIHKIFNVVKINIDTAGSEKSEFEFHALDHKIAYALRTLIYDKKSKIVKAEKSVDQESLDQKPEYTYRNIMNLGFADLLKVGFTQNHLRSGSIIIVFIFWLYDNLKEVGVNLDEYQNEIPSQEDGISFFLVLALLFLIGSVIISLFQTVIRFFDLKFLRSDQGFKIISGLLTRREVSAVDHKIQQIVWSDNLLKKIFGFYDLTLKQASSAQLKTNQAIKIPGCNQSQIDVVTQSLFRKTAELPTTYRPIQKNYFTRYFTIMTLAVLSIISIMYLLDLYENWVYVLLIYFYLIITRYLSFKKLKFAFDDKMLSIKGGVFGDKFVLLPLYKLQAVEITQTPYQYRKKLASLLMFTAAGMVRIPYITIVEANYLYNYSLYKIESDKRKWM